MGLSLERVVGFWDEHVAAWLAGEDPMPAPLPDWFASYQGKGMGAVTRSGFPEPYAGAILASPRMVVLGLNPGRHYPQFQARDGVFAQEIRQLGSYSDWMATTPYLRRPWTELVSPNRYYQARVGFMRRWLDDPDAPARDLVIFEAYPWHSTAVTAAMTPPPRVVEQFVWQPIADLPVTEVFAFGRPWHALATTLGLSLVAALGAGGDAYGSAVANRAVRVYALPSGQRLIVEWHTGSAGPPSSTEIGLLRHALHNI